MYGEGSLDETYALANLATALGNLGRKQEALDMYAKVDAAFTRALGPDHPVRAGVLNNIASIHTDVDDWDDAQKSFAEALRIAKHNANGPSDLVATLARNLALLHIYQSHPDEAEPLAKLSLEQSLAVFGEGHMNIAMSHAVLGRVFLLKHEYPKAREHLERAVELGHDSEVEAAVNRFNLAQALVEDPNATEDDRQRGMQLARGAEKVVAEGQDVEATHREILEWLDAHQAGFPAG